MADAPCTALEAVARAARVVQSGEGQYILGTGNYDSFSPSCVAGVLFGGGPLDKPWTVGLNSKTGKYELGSDCAGFAICYAWKLCRHRPGFNVGDWSTVEDDINVNSIYEDACHKQELAELAPQLETPKPGDLLLYPSFKVRGKKFTGHVAIIAYAMPDYIPGRYDRLNIMHCHGPDGFKPGAVRTDGSLFVHHDALWPKDEHRCHIVRMKER